jgi:tRNA threonylcarbamoyladenosine biosynthesis protein TsaB
MSLILNIDTATAQASVSLAFDGKLLNERINDRQNDHAAWIHVAIAELLRDNGHKMTDVKAIAVVAGPGSYTGLRVGMATAKGFCYALNIPLLTLNTLELMAYAASKDISSPMLLCPMLDARRMEVFTALYDAELKELLPPCAMILETGSFAEWLQKTQVIFFGSGSSKWKAAFTHNNAVFKDIFYHPADISLLSYRQFGQANFSDLAGSAPIYLKDFHTHHKKG